MNPAAANEATAATPKAAAAASTARKSQSAVDRREAAITKQKALEQQVQSAWSCELHSGIVGVFLSLQQNFCCFAESDRML